MANLLSTTVNGSLLALNNGVTNAYTTASNGRLYLGSSAQNDYSIYTHMENFGGNYTKLTLDWHTGIKIGASQSYGGIRFYSDAINNGGTKLFSVGEGDGNVRVTNTLLIGSNTALHTGGGQTIGGTTYFSGGESLNLYGIRGRFTNEYIHLYNKVGIGHPSGWGQGQAETPSQGLSTYGGMAIAYGTGATSTFYGRIDAAYSSDRYQMSFRGGAGNYWWITNDSDKLGIHLNGTGDRIYFATDGNIWSAYYNDWLSNVLANKQNSSTAITTSNIGSQSVNYATSAGNADTVDGRHADYFYPSNTDNGYSTGDINGNTTHQRLWGTDSVQDLVQFNAPTTVEYSTDGTNWVSTTVPTDVFTGKIYGAWGGMAMNVGNNRGGWRYVRMTWVNFGYRFFSHFTIAHSTNGHSFNFVFQKSDLNGNNFTEAFRQNGIGSWPGYTFAKHSNVSGWWDTRDIRLVFELNNNPSFPDNAIQVGHIGIMGSYGSFTRLYDWDYNRNVTFANQINASGGNSSQWNTAYGWGNHASAGYQSASTAITTSNIGSQSVNYASSSGNADTVDGYHMNQSLLTTSGPTFANVYASGWFRNYGNQGIYNESYGTHFYSYSGSNWGITGSGSNVYLAFRSNHESTIRGYVHANTDNNIGFLNNSGDWGLRVSSARNVEVFGTDLIVGSAGGGYTSITMKDGDEGDRVIHCNSNRIGFLNQSGGWGSWCSDDGSWNTAGGLLVAGNTTWFTGSGGQIALENIGDFARFAFNGLDFYDWQYGISMTISNGDITANNSFRAPIFYDSNNTGYYLDPNSTSNLLTVNILNTYVGNAIYFGGGNNYFNWDGARINSNVGIQSGSDMRAPQFRVTNSTNNAYITGNSDWGLAIVNDNGFIQFGPANNSWSHIYSNKSFYFNQDLYVNGSRVVLNSGTWGINITGDAGSVDGVDSSAIVYGGAGRASNYVSSMDDPNQKSGFYFKDSPTGQPFGDWWNWMTIAGNSWQSSNNYAFQIAHAFHSDDAYIRRMTNGSLGSWRALITSGNIGSQSVNYASGAGNSTNLDGRSSSRYLYYRGINAASDFQTYQSSDSVIRFDQINDYNTHSNAPGGYNYGGVLSMRGDNFGFQLWGAHTGEFWFKTQWNNDQYSGWKYVVHSGNIGSQSVNYANSAGNASTATTLQTARTLTIGNTGKAFNGGANLSWSISEIGAAPAGIDYTIVVMTDGGNMELTFTKGVLTAVNPV